MRFVTEVLDFLNIRRVSEIAHFFTFLEQIWLYVQTLLCLNIALHTKEHSLNWIFIISLLLRRTCTELNRLLA